MADRNTYLKYKRDQRNLVYWIIDTSAQIIKKLPSESHATGNTAGVVSLAALQSYSTLIAKHLDPIPPTIFRLFESIIDARKQTHNLFLEIAASDKDPEIQRSNESHKHWINGLTQAFQALGGDSWKVGKTSQPEPSDEDAEQVIFANKYSTLSLGSQTNAEGEEVDQSASEEEEIEAAAKITAGNSAKRSKQKAHKKGKKGKKGRKSKTKSKTATTNAPDLQDVPLESYRIIEDETGIVTDYLMAVYSLAQQMMELRHHLQGVWRKVAYNNVNSAIAANVSNVAIGIIKDTQSQIFVDFPGHDSFDTVMQTLTRGNPDKAQGKFHVESARQGPEGAFDVSHQCEINVREEFFLNCYQDLFDFIADYQQTRSGKPTKPMLKNIQNWNPTLNLAQATQQERMNWRRVYTINWLYDLVNLFSSVVVQRRTMNNQSILLESVDWSRNGPWNQYRRLFGINDFAGDITHLAVQKQGTDIRPKIFPHHVFQLQCMVDALAVSRGWSIGALVGHVMTHPANNFRPRRDVDIFMDRDNERVPKGHCHSVDVLKAVFQQDAVLHGDPKRNKILHDLVVDLRDDFVSWLGESKYMYGLTNIPPSRFSNTNANGLWEYSPFLCGAGLSEALELSCGAAMYVWDDVPELLCILHLHNMLVQKGLLKRPIGLWETLAFVFADSFFDGEPPASQFLEAFQVRSVKSTLSRESLRNRAQKHHVARYATDYNSLLESSVNRFYKTKSLLNVYKAVKWVPDRIPDEEIPIETYLASLRLAETKQIRDLVTGEVTLEETDLVKRLRANGMSDKAMIELVLTVTSAKPEPMPLPPELRKMSFPDGCSTEGLSSSDGSAKGKLGLPMYLDLLQADFASDICGQHRPLSSPNCLWILSHCYMVFMSFEEALEARCNPTWAMVYKNDFKLSKHKRVHLTTFALAEHDPECLKIMAEEFENHRTGFIDHSYWDDLVSPEDMKKYLSGDGQTPPGTDTCTMM